MALAYETSSNLASSTATASWSHGGSANTRGVVVVVTGGAVDATSGVTYGGVAMSRMQTGANTAGESGTSSVWFLGSGVGTGTQTVQVTRTTGDAYIATAFSVTAAADTEYITGDSNSSTNTSDLATSLTIPSGRVVFIAGGAYSGENALGSVADKTGQTRAHSQDFGNFVSVISRRTALYTGTGAALTTFGWTQSNDDGGWAVIAIAEATDDVLQATGTVSATTAVSGAITSNRPVSGTVTATSAVSGDATITSNSISVSGTIASSTTASGIVSLIGGEGSSPATYVATAGAGDAFQSGLTITKPGGLPTDGTAVAVFVIFSWNNNLGTITAPSGAVDLGLTQAGTNFSHLYAKFVGAESNYAFSWSTGSQWSGGYALFFSGIDPGQSLAALAKQVTTGTSATFPSASVTADEGAGLAWFGVTMDYGASETHTPPTNFTETIDNPGATAAYRIAPATGTQTASGGTVSASQSVISSLVAVAPGGGGGSGASLYVVSGTVAATSTVSGDATVNVPGVISVSGTVAATTTASGVATSTRQVSGTIAATSTVNGNLNPPFAASTSGRAILDQYGDPYYSNVYTLWNLVAYAGAYDEQGVGTTTPATSFEAVCAELEANGYNGIQVLSVSSSNNGERGPFADGRTWDGVTPWGGGGIGDLNESYWSRVDDLIDIAAGHGITVWLFLTSGYSLASGGAFAALNTTNGATFGTAIGNRYKDKPNIIWCHGSDYFAGDEAGIAAIQTAIEATGDTHLLTIIYNAETSTTIDSQNNAPGSPPSGWDFAFTYSYNAAALEVRRSWSDHTKPVYHGDGYYYQDGTTITQNVLQLMSDLRGWAITSGSQGFFFGSEGTWAGDSAGQYADIFTEEWPDTHISAFTAAWTALTGWEGLEPDLTSTFVTSSRGTDATAIAPGGGNGEYNLSDGQNNYLTAAFRADGTLAVLYTPTARTGITIDDSHLTASYSVKWMDPFTGATTPETVDTSYDTPGTNSEGFNGWFLVFEESAGSTYGVSGTISGTSAASGAITKTTSVNGTIASTSAASGAITAALPVSGTATSTTTVAGAAKAIHPATGEIVVLSALSGAATSTRQVSGTIEVISGFGCSGGASSEEFTPVTYSADSQNSAPYAAPNAFDQRWSSAAEERWQSASTAMPHWVRGDLSEAKAAEWYSVDPGRSGTNPSAWTFQGSNNGTDWDVLDTRTGQDFTDLLTKVYEFTNSTEYLYYRQHITAGQSSAASVSELQFGSGTPRCTLLSHLPASSMVGADITTGLVFVVNETVTIHALKVYVGTNAATFTTRIVDEDYNVLAEEAYAALATESGYRRLPITPLVLTPGSYMIELYSGIRYAIRSVGAPTVDMNYGPGNEITIPATGTVTFRSSTLTARYAIGDNEATLNLGQLPINAFDFSPGGGSCPTIIKAPKIATGTIPAVSATSGAITSNLPISGTVQSVSAVSGQVTASGFGVSGSIAAVSTVSGAATSTRQASGTVEVVSAASGQIVAAGIGVSGTAASITTVSGDATAVARPTGTVPVVSTLSGDATAVARPTGTVAAVITVSGSVTSSLPASGTVAATSTASGAVTSTLPASGTVPVVSGLSGQVSAAGYGASGEVVSTTTVSGVVTKIARPTGTVQAVSDSSGGVTIVILPSASGRVDAVSGTSGSVTVNVAASGTVDGISTVSGSITKTTQVSGTIAATSTLSGDVSKKALLQISGTVAAVSGLNGQIGATYIGTAGTVVVVSGLSGNVRLAGVPDIVHPGRILIVKAEDRTLRIAAQDRVLDIEAEDRTARFV